MFRIIGLLLLSITFLPSHGQYLKKSAIGNSGCSAYCYCDISDADFAFSKDSSEVYTVECINDSTYYGIICVKLKESLSDMDAAEDLLIAYLDHIKSNFKITGSVGYGKGHRLNDREDTRGVLDYWTDEEKNNWKVKGWTDGNYIGIMYAYSSKDLPESKVNVFLDGFRLPGM